MSTASPRSCERATENPERQAPRSLPILWPADELPQYLAVLSAGPMYLARVAESSYTRTETDVGAFRRSSTAVPALTTSDYACLGGRWEYRLRNPLPEGEIPGEPWWTYSGTKLETADTAKESLQLTGSPLLGVNRKELAAVLSWSDGAASSRSEGPALLRRLSRPRLTQEDQKAQNAPPRFLEGNSPGLLHGDVRRR